MECGESRAFYLRHLLPQTLYHKYYCFISYLFDNGSDHRYIHYWIAYLVDGYTRPQGSITVSSTIDIKAESTLTEPIRQDNAELIRQTEEENKRRKEEQWAEIASILKRHSKRYLLWLK